jgi:single-strand DNA-binding protein
MANFNRVTLIGNLTRDPQVKQLPNQSTVADFGLASNRRFKTQAGEDREEVLFIDCAAFGKQAEVIGQYCKKGRQLFVEGRLKYDTWDDKQGGGKRSKISVVVENFQFLGSRDGDAADHGRQHELWDASHTSPNHPSTASSSAPAATKKRGRRIEQPVDATVAVAETDIPF